jgi:hypothetical protein
MSKFLLTVCAFGLLLSPAFAETAGAESPAQSRDVLIRMSVVAARDILHLGEKLDREGGTSWRRRSDADIKVQSYPVRSDVTAEQRFAAFNESTQIPS